MTPIGKFLRLFVGDDLPSVRIRDFNGAAHILSCHGLDTLVLETMLETCPQGFFNLRAALFQEISGSGRQDKIFVTHTGVTRIGWQRISIRYVPRDEIVIPGMDTSMICRTLRISAVV